MRVKGTVVGWALAAALLGSTGPAGAAQVSGVELPDHLQLRDAGELVLNGAGVRRKFFFKIYVGALYVPHSVGDAAALLALDGPKVVLMHFLYHEVDRDKLVAAWHEGFEENTTASELAALHEHLERFSALFPTVHEGDELRLSLLADGRTQVRLNGALRGTVVGADFQSALLKVFVGAHPADGALKEGMLGGRR